jgi:cytochrome c peroxidase
MWMTIIGLVALMAPALAADQASVARGKDLFYSTRLGSNQKSCATCHPDGMKLEKAASFEGRNLQILSTNVSRGLLKEKRFLPNQPTWLQSSCT